MTALSCVQGSGGYIRFVGIFLLTALFFQTWKTSRLTEEALSQSVKVKEWFCCAALHHILEVKHHILNFNNSSIQLASKLNCFKLNIRSWPSEKQNVNKIIMFEMFSNGYLEFEVLSVWLHLCCLRSSCFSGTFDLVINTLHLSLWGLRDFQVSLALLRCDQSWSDHGKCDSLAVRRLQLSLLWFKPYFSASFSISIYSSLFALMLKANNSLDELYKI